MPFISSTYMPHKQSSPMVGIYMPQNIMRIFKINQEKKNGKHKLSLVFRYLCLMEELLRDSRAFELTMVNEPSVVEPLSFFCI